MARNKTRWATIPPNCEAMENANNRFYKQNSHLIRSDGTYRKLTMGKKDEPYRKEWMELYIEECKRLDAQKGVTAERTSTKNLKLKPGTLKQY